MRHSDSVYWDDFPSQEDQDEMLVDLESSLRFQLERGFTPRLMVVA